MQKGAVVIDNKRQKEVAMAVVRSDWVCGDMKQTEGSAGGEVWWRRKIDSIPAK
jgi:hypothetical protein